MLILINQIITITTVGPGCCNFFTYFLIFASHTNTHARHKEGPKGAGGSNWVHRDHLGL